MESTEHFRYNFPGMYKYEGMVLRPIFPIEAVEASKTYSFDARDVVIITYPKSGSIVLPPHI